MAKPLLSIVIANYNYGHFLEDAIRSVLAQGVGSKAELIICDAASTDNSVDVIKKYVNGLPPNTSIYDWTDRTSQSAESDVCSQTSRITWWCSEKDGGQSAAFNKGFSHARGEWITWLNSDDLYLPGTLTAFANLVEKKPKAEWITGNKVHFDSDSGRMVSVNWGPHCQPPLLRGNHAMSAVFGPSTFFKKVLYERMGPIDERLHYAMDSAYWAKFTMAGVRQIRLNKLCWAFRDHTESKTVGIQTKAVADRRRGETELWRKDTGYRFEVSFKNVWYWAWVLWRVIDGSWVVRAIMKHRYEGESIKEII